MRQRWSKFISVFPVVILLYLARVIMSRFSRDRTDRITNRVEYNGLGRRSSRNLAARSEAAGIARSFDFRCRSDGLRLSNTDPKGEVVRQGSFEYS
jgi:YD repeat-containing protein